MQTVYPLRRIGPLGLQSLVADTFEGSAEREGEFVVGQMYHMMGPVSVQQAWPGRLACAKCMSFLP